MKSVRTRWRVFRFVYDWLVLCACGVWVRAWHRSAADGGRKLSRKGIEPNGNAAVSCENTKDGESASPPRVTVIVPVYGKCGYTVRCLDSLGVAKTQIPFDVIVIDDGSPDDTVAVLSARHDIRLHSLPENHGFVHACNVGAALATGEYLVFLNNDTTVGDGWLDALIGTFRDHPRCGLAGAKLVFPDGTLQEAGGIVFHDGHACNYGRGADAEDPHFNFARQVDYCSGACIAISRALFEAVGGFDVRYAPAYYEDTDLAFAVWRVGREVWYQPRARIVHHEGATGGTDVTRGVKHWQEVNRSVFAAKWRSDLERQPAVESFARSPVRCASHRCTMRVLVADVDVPHVDRDSGSVRADAILRTLQRLGCHVVFLPVAPSTNGCDAGRLQCMGVEWVHAPSRRQRLHWWYEHGTELDVVILSRLPVAAECLHQARCYASQAPVVFDTVDLHYLRLRRGAILAGDPAAGARAERMRHTELDLIRHADLTLVVSGYERDLLHKEVPGAQVRVLSNIQAIRDHVPPFASRSGFLFIGNFEHLPNVDAVRYLCEEIMPNLRAKVPGVVLHVVGFASEEKVGDFAAEDVRIHGQVSDLVPLLDTVRVSLVPLRYGAGVKGKINLAMGCGLPVVTTGIGAEGMFLKDGIHAMIADDAQDFAQAAARLYRDESLWSALSRESLAHTRRFYSEDHAVETLRNILHILKPGVLEKGAQPDGA